MGAGVRQGHRGQGLIRPGRELPDRPPRKMHGEGGRKTKLRKSTHLLDLPVHPALMGAYEDLMGPEGDGAAAEGP